MAAEIGTAVVSEAASKVAGQCYDSVKREISYVFKYQSYIDVLKNQLKDLEGKRQMVEEPVNHARRQGDEIYKSVEDWLNSVDDFIENVAKPITGGEDEAKKRCFKGLCPNLCKRYSLSKKAVKAAKEGADLLGKGNFPNVSYRPAGDLKRQVEELKFLRQRVEKDIENAERQGEEIFEDVKLWLIRVKDFDDKAVNAAEEVGNLLRKGNFTNVSYRPALEKTELVCVRGYEQFDSRLKVFQDVMEGLNDSDVDMIGVYGMGGVGKTTLVKQVARKVIEDKLFDEVIMAEVTQTPDHKKIQDKIARDLDLEFGQQESMFQRADRLRVRLKKEKRVLIILDNIWAKFEFDAVGIPFRDDENQRKNDERRRTIILTSRSRDLLCNDMNSQKNFPIEVLSNEEAEQLFEKIVGDSAKHSDFQHIAHEIVGRCGGLPVALNTIANALKNKSLPIWKEALDQLRNSNPREIHGMDANVYLSIELSYNFLESDEAKHLFLLCSLHRTGDSINAFNLLKYGMGLGLFKKVHTLESARYRVHRLIDSLKASCLLLDGDAEDEIKMHDIICAVAVSIAEEKLMFNIQNISDLEEKRINKDSTAISIPYNIQELPETLEFPQLELFFLSNEYGSSLQIPYLLFEGMKQLKVLNLTKFWFSSLPSSLGCLINLQTLCLESCELQDIAMVGQLKKLEILSFRDSHIEQLPTEIGQLRHLQLLDLTNCGSLEVIPPNVISKLSQLEELYMGDSFKKWEKEGGGGNASLVELKGLSKLTTLEIHIPSAEIIPQDLISVELERFQILVGNELGWYDKYKTSRFMKLQGIEKINLLGNYRMKMLLKRTEHLFLEEIKGLQKNVNELDDKEGFPRLKHLRVEYCYEISHIVSLVGQIPYKVFPLLESLSLHNLINLEKVCQGQLTDNQSFSNLMIIKVKECHRLKHLFSFSMAKNLLRLQKIEVGDCSNLEMIVGPDMEKSTTTLGYKKVISEDDSQVKVIFPSLEELELESLTSIENIWHSQFQYQNLKKVTLRNCKGLKYMFSYSMVNIIVQLEHLDVDECESMEAVVVDSISTGLGGRDEGKLIEMVFPKLNYLRLRGLPKLTSFAIGMAIHSVEFPSLRELTIIDCPNLIRFISMCSLDDNILSEMQPRHFFDEKVRLSNLEVLTLQYMENLRQIWHHQLAYDSLRKFKKLKILDCEELISIFPPMVRLPNLEELILWSMKNLRQIWHHQLASDSLKKLNKLEILYCEELISIFPPMVALPNLMRLRIVGCDGLRSLMTLSMAQSMMKLTRMLISKCEKMEEIIQQELGEEVKDDRIVFNQLIYLTLVRLTSLKSFCLGNYTLEFSSLEQVHVSKCRNMKTFSQGVLLTPKLHKVNLGFYTGNEEGYWEGNLNSTIQKMFKEMVGFRDTWDLRLSLHPRLKEIWHSQKLPVSFFNELRYLEVDGCTDMSSAIPMNLLWCLNNLYSLKVSNCDSLEVVFHMEELNVDGHFGPLLPELEVLDLINLPKLQRFCNITGNIIALPSLTRMTIENCPNMEAFVSNSTSVHTTANKEHQEMTLEENFLIDDIQPFFNKNVALPNLMTLHVRGCHGWRSLMTLSMAQSMVKLTGMEITYCEKMEEIIQQELGEEMKDDRIVFSQLEYLVLDNLSSLKSFCLGNYTLEFSSLEDFYLRNCPNMKTFSQGVLLTPKLHKVKDWEGSGEEYWEEEYWEGNLNSTVQKIFKEMVGFRYISDLRLSLHPHLKEKWPSQELPVSFFNRLRYLEVDGCTDMSSAIPMNLLRCLNNLKCLIVSNCDSLEDVFHLEELNIDEYFGPLLPKLENLELTNLSKLKRFCNFTGNIIALPSLTWMWIENCPNMEAFVSNSTSVHMRENFLIDDIQPFFNENVAIPRLEELELSTMPKLFRLRKESLECSKLARSWVSFQNLTTLDVSGSEGLRSLITLSTTESVEKLIIREMTQHVGEEVKTDIGLVFVHLKYLKLHCLPSFVSFCVGNYILEFPSLLQVIFS